MHVTAPPRQGVHFRPGAVARPWNYHDQRSEFRLNESLGPVTRHPIVSQYENIMA